MDRGHVIEVKEVELAGRRLYRLWVIDGSEDRDAECVLCIERHFGHPAIGAFVIWNKHTVSWEKRHYQRQGPEMAAAILTKEERA